MTAKSLIHNPRMTRRRRIPAQKPKPSRIAGLDAARGFAVVMMVAYHFCFDLTWVGWAGWRMLDDPGWIAWRSAIVASFLFVVGVSLAVRDASPRTASTERSFWRRWLQIAAAALLVSIGSYALFPQSFIYFGVLHFVALVVLFARAAPRLGAWAALPGVAALLAGIGFHHEAFDPRAINWIGFALHKPLTEDYVPLFPWLGVVLLGCAFGSAWLKRGTGGRLLSALEEAIPKRAFDALGVLGRWSLTIYLVHQPILLGTMVGVKQLT